MRARQEVGPRCGRRRAPRVRRERRPPGARARPSAGLDRVDAGARARAARARRARARRGASVKTPSVHALARQASACSAALVVGVATEVRGRVILGEALEQRRASCRLRAASSAAAASPPIGRERSRGRSPRTRAGGGEPVVPQRARVADRVEVDGERARALMRAAALATDCQSDDADGDADRVDRDVERGAHPARDERLVDLVADRVERAEREREPGPCPSRGRAARRAPRTRPCARACAARDPSRRARCRGRAPTRRRRSAPPRRATGSQRRTSGAAHRPMIGSPANQERGEGTRCESGTVPPL